MMQLLAGFAALSMIAGALMTLLPEGSLRHTASMAVGLVMLLYWAQGLQALCNNLPSLSTLPTTVLTASGVSLTQAEASLLQEATP